MAIQNEDTFVKDREILHLTRLVHEHETLKIN